MPRKIFAKLFLLRADFDLPPEWFVLQNPTMAAQPPDQLRTGEIDIRGLINDSAIKAIPPQTDLNDPRFNVPGVPGSNLLHGYHGLRISWSDWTNIIFAVLTVISGFICTVYFFETPEKRGKPRLSEREYLYQKPFENSRDQIGDDRDEHRLERLLSRQLVEQANRRVSSASASSSAAGNSENASGASSGQPGFNPGPNGDSSGASGSREARSTSSASSNIRVSRPSRGIPSRTRRSHSVSTSTSRQARSSRPTSNACSKPASAKTASATRPIASHAPALAGPVEAKTKSGATVFRGSAMDFVGLGRHSVVRGVMGRDRDAYDRH